MVMGYVPSPDEAIFELSNWIDLYNSHKDAEAQTWGRIAKIGEEFGEVVNAYIGVTNQNPRKGQYGNMDDVVKELLDVALTALAAVVHVSKTDTPLEALRDHIMRAWLRAGLDE